MQRSITQLFCLLVFSKSPKRLDLISQTFSKFNCFLFTVAQYNSFEAGSGEIPPLPPPHRPLPPACWVSPRCEARALRCVEPQRTHQPEQVSCVPGSFKAPRHPPSALLTHRTNRETRGHKIKNLHSALPAFILTPKLWPLIVFRKVEKDKVTS